MFNSETLEVAIGMVFLFLMMSLTCTAIKEWIEGLLKWRAMDLERAIRNLLDDDSGQTSAALYRHPGIYALFQGTYEVGALAQSWFTMGTGAGRHMPLTARRNLPSYIPTAHFATAFIDHIAHGEPIHPEAAPPASGWRAKGAALAAMGRRILAALGLGKTPPAAPAAATPWKPKPRVPLTIELLSERAALHPDYLRRLMYSAIDYAEGDIAQVRRQIEHWFDGAMDRASGWYKRRTQALLFLIGVLAAVVLNVDALNVLHHLTTDKTLRESVVRRAETAAAAPAPASGPQAGALDAFEQTRDELETVGLPIGWKMGSALPWFGIAPIQFCTTSATPAGLAERCSTPAAPGHAWVRIAMGWAVTAMAIMLGAPFWFDVLNKIMIIRSTVKPHEKSPEEPSQDGSSSDKVQRLLVSAAPAADPPPVAPAAPAPTSPPPSTPPVDARVDPTPTPPSLPAS